MNEEQALDQFAPACNLYAFKAHKMYGDSLPFDRGDYFQIAQTYVLEAVRDFNPNKGMKLSTYIIQRIRWGLMETTRNHSRNNITTVSMATAKDGSDWIEPEHEDKIELGEHENFYALIRDLEEQERSILIARFIHEQKLGDIAKGFGITPQAIQARITSILAKMALRTDLVTS